VEDGVADSLILYDIYHNGSKTKEIEKLAKVKGAMK
jgi:hypothetical protein